MLDDGRIIMDGTRGVGSSPRKVSGWLEARTIRRGDSVLAKQY